MYLPRVFPDVHECITLDSQGISSQECLLLYLPRVFPDVHETLRWILNVLPPKNVYYCIYLEYFQMYMKHYVGFSMYYLQECLLLYLPRVFPDVHETLRWILKVFPPKNVYYCIYLEYFQMYMKHYVGFSMYLRYIQID